MNTHAAPADNSASLPHLLEKLLQQQSIEYQLRPTPQHIPGSQQVQACLLCDSIGTVLALFPRDHLLDLKRAGALLGRELEPVRAAQLQRILAKRSPR